MVIEMKAFDSQGRVSYSESEEVLTAAATVITVSLSLTRPVPVLVLRLHGLPFSLLPCGR